MSHSTSIQFHVEFKHCQKVLVLLIFEFAKAVVQTKTLKVMILTK